MTSTTEFVNIIEFNDFLSDNLIEYDINTYFTKIHELFNNSTDISFMEYFLSLIDKKDEFCVEHTKLIEYGIIGDNRSNNIKRCIEDYDFVENTDYLGFAAERSAAKKRGGHNAKNYKMKPHVFKMCLMRSKNENKYAKYFLELEECFYYYQDYQIKYQKKIINGISKENKSLHSKIDELLKYAKNTNEKLDDANDNINEMKDDIENLTDKVEEVRDEFREQTEHINPPPEDDDNIHMFVLLQYPNENNKFRIIRGQSKHLDKSITQDMNIVIDKRYHPNPIDAFTALKNKIKKLDKEEVKKIKDSYKNKTITREDKNDLLEDNRNSPAISIKYNTININYKKISLNEFIELVNKCADLGKETFIP